MTRYSLPGPVLSMSREQLLDHIQQNEKTIRTLIQCNARQAGTISENRSTIERLEVTLREVTEERKALEVSLIEAEERLARAERLLNTP